jgi:hypothetical protein
VAFDAGLDLAVGLQILQRLVLGIMVAFATAFSIKLGILLGVILGVLLVAELDVALGHRAVFHVDLDHILYRRVKTHREEQAGHGHEHRKHNTFSPHSLSLSPPLS